MENNSIDATPQRPDGERILNAPLVEMNLYEFIKQIKNETTWKESDRNSITLFKSAVLIIVLIGLHENAEIKPHKTDGIITIQVLEGKVNFLSEQQSSLIEKGQMIVLAENNTHSVIGLAESFFLLTMVLNNKSEAEGNDSIE